MKIQNKLTFLIIVNVLTKLLFYSQQYFLLMISDIDWGSDFEYDELLESVEASTTSTPNESK